MKFSFPWKNSTSRGINHLTTVTAVFTIVSAAVVFHTPSTVALATTNRHFTPKNIQNHKNTNSMRFATSNSNEEEKEERDDNDNDDDNTKSKKSQQQIKKPATWNPLRLMVLKLGFTEPAWTSPLNYGKKNGVFNCAYCGLDLFDSSGMHDSGSGWPSFWRSIEDGHVKYKKEFDGRLECQCGRCSSHLGHVFLDGPLPDNVPSVLFETSPPSDPRGRRANGNLPRFCVNGASLNYEKREDEAKIE